MTPRDLTCLAVLLVAACGPRPPPQSWVERETLGTSRAGGSDEAHATTTTPGLAIDLASLDPPAIDALDDATALAALTELGERTPAARVALRAARLAHHRGDLAEARALIARAAAAADHDEVRTELAALAQQLAEPPVDPDLVAVLLPLTGRHAAVGGELRAAIELVPGTRWVFLDTRGEPAGAVAAVEAARKQGAIALLGPVGTREAIAAARAATLAQLPIGLLAPADGADAASGVFRLVGSPADEARAVARMAHADNFPSVAVFAPRDDVGEETADAFAAEAERLGLRVTARGSYDPTGGNLEPDVKEFLNLVPARNPRLAEHLRKNPKRGLQTFSPDVPFTLLYLPDRYDRAAIVAAFLPYFGVELRTQEFADPHRLQRKHGGRIPQVVQLVGGAGWNHPSLPIRGGAAVQGALVVDVFAGDAGGDLAAAFRAKFQQRTARAPSAAAAEAHDAALLISSARRDAAAAAQPRATLRAALARGKLDDGACGPAAMGVDGELARTPLLLEVVGDELVVAP
jgi:ABC-type branched-subunit amino acid transport system substrate-binding protein